MLGKVFDWIEIGGLPLLFFLVFLEGNPIIGSFIPGQVLVIFMGFLISTGPPYLILVSIFGVFISAFLGDIIGYYMGKVLGVKGLAKFGLSKDNAMYKSSNSFLKKYGVSAIILGRQLNPTRAFMPFLAGSLKMKTYKFLLVSAISCFIWSTLSIYLGYYFGNIIVNNFNFFAEFLIAFCVYIAFVFFTYKKFKYYFNQNQEFLKEYSLDNVLAISFFIVVFIVFCFILKWDYYILFNDYFVFLYVSGLYILTGFILSKYMLVFMILLTIFFLFIKREYRLIVSFLWGCILVLCGILIFKAFLGAFFGVNIYYSIVLIVYLCFYLWIISKKFCSKKKCIFLDVFFILFLMLMVVTKFSLTGNLFITILSLVVGAIMSEFVIILSNFRILDRSLYELHEK